MILNNKLSNLNFNMQPFIMIQKLQHILTKSTHTNCSQSSNYPVSHPQHTQQIKQQLTEFYEYITQQFIKLSAYYQTKIQYQSMDYEQEIDCLKQEIQRQYKVIGLMKLELEDLVFLVNQQRNTSSNRNNNNIQQNQSIDNREEHMRDQEEYKQWRVKKSQATQMYYQQQQASHNTNSRNHQQHANSTTQQTNNQSQQYPSYSRSTISGLQIIAQEQTQRTLMSAGDEEQHYPIENDYFENDQCEEIDDRQDGSDEHQVKEENDFSNQQRRDQYRQDQRKQYGSQTRNPQSHMLIEDQTEKVQEQSQNQDYHFSILQKQQPVPSKTQHFQKYSYPQTLFTLENKHISFHTQNTLPHRNQSTLTQEQNQPQHQSNHHQTNSPANYNPIQLTNHSSQTSHKPQIIYKEHSQKQSTNETVQQRVTQKSNFVQNPFAKKKPSNPTVVPNHQQQSHSNQQISFMQQPTKGQKLRFDQQQQKPQVNQQQTRIFMKQFRPSYQQNNQPIHNQQTNQKINNKNSVMSILQLIATNSHQIHSKRSQKSNNLPSSRSRSKSKNNKQSKKSIDAKSSTKQKKRTSNNNKPIYCNYQTQEQIQIDSQNNSRFTMVRCPTSEDITSSQRYNPRSFEQTECFTSNDFRQNQEFDSCDKEIKSFHTTFGRPTSNEQLKQATAVNYNRQNTLQNFFSSNQRKGSIKWKKQTLPLKQNFANKQNQRQRRMSQKAPQSKSSIVNKKMPTKYIKPNSSFASQQSVHSMLQSHLQNSNKFLVGTKKQQVKYDGQRLAIGNQQVRHGHGTLYYSNGLIYEGEFTQNKRHGFGILKFNHVQLYSGEWSCEQLSGKGKIRNCAIINKKKKQATQGLQNNNTNNMHSNMFAKWISYCGEFMNNRFEGQGTLYLQGGEKFVGLFRNGVADGQGSLYRKNGQVENGIWRNNVLVERIDTQWS